MFDETFHLPGTSEDFFLPKPEQVASVWNSNQDNLNKPSEYRTEQPISL